MSEIISKELLSDVLKLDAEPYNIESKGNTLYYSVYEDRYECDILDNEINIYELSHKCKEWALVKGWGLSSGISDHITKVRFCTATNDCFNTHKCFNDDTELEAIFKACQWILENKDKK